MASFAWCCCGQLPQPTILNKDFLAHCNIVPESWETVETVTPPAISIIKYSNGVQWMMDQNRLTITEVCDQPLRQNEDSKVHDQASLYVETLPYTPYTALGLNYTKSIVSEDPEIWTTHRFLNETFHNQGLVMRPSFTIDIDDGTLNLNFMAGNMNRAGKSRKSVIIECNIHYGMLSDLATLKTKILGWKKGKDMIYSKLVTILGVH